MNLHHHPFTLRQLQYVVAVAERASFRRAAQDCGVSQPSLSAQIAQVEAALQLQIFDRTHRRVTVIPGAVEWVEQARRLLQSAETLGDIAAQLRNPFAGTLRIGAIPTIAPYFLPEVASPLRAAFPAIRFVWFEDKTATLLGQLERRELDAAILAGDPVLPAFDAAPIGHDPFLLAALPDHPLLTADEQPTAANLADQELFLLSDGHCFRDQVFAFCNRSGRSESPWHATSLATLIQMTASSHGVTLIPSLAAAVENRRSTLALRAFQEPQPSRPILLVWRRDAANAAALRAMAHLMAGIIDTLQAAPLP